MNLWARHCSLAVCAVALSLGGCDTTVDGANDTSVSFQYRLINSLTSGNREPFPRLEQ